MPAVPLHSSTSALNTSPHHLVSVEKGILAATINSEISFLFLARVVIDYSCLGAVSQKGRFLCRYGKLHTVNLRSWYSWKLQFRAPSHEPDVRSSVFFFRPPET